MISYAINKIIWMKFCYMNALSPIIPSRYTCVFQALISQSKIVLSDLPNNGRQDNSLRLSQAHFCPRLDVRKLCNSWKWHGWYFKTIVRNFFSYLRPCLWKRWKLQLWNRNWWRVEIMRSVIFCSDIFQMLKKLWLNVFKKLTSSENQI